MLQGIFVQSFAQILEELRGTKIKSYLTPKIESSLKPTNYDAKPKFLHVYRTKVQNVHVVLERDPENLKFAHVFYMPLPNR